MGTFSKEKYILQIFRNFHREENVFEVEQSRDVFRKMFAKFPQISSPFFHKEIFLFAMLYFFLNSQRTPLDVS